MRLMSMSAIPCSLSMSCRLGSYRQRLQGIRAARQAAAGAGPVGKRPVDRPHLPTRHIE